MGCKNEQSMFIPFRRSQPGGGKEIAGNMTKMMYMGTNCNSVCYVESHGEEDISQKLKAKKARPDALIMLQTQKVCGPMNLESSLRQRMVIDGTSPG
jgi:hypothetical protein